MRGRPHGLRFSYASFYVGNGSLGCPFCIEIFNAQDFLGQFSERKSQQRNLVSEELICESRTRASRLSSLQHIGWRGVGRVCAMEAGSDEDHEGS